jgi:hypothetical protein
VHCMCSNLFNIDWTCLTLFCCCGILEVYLKCKCTLSTLQLDHFDPLHYFLKTSIRSTLPSQMIIAGRTWWLSLFLADMTCDLSWIIFVKVLGWSGMFLILQRLMEITNDLDLVNWSFRISISEDTLTTMTILKPFDDRSIDFLRTAKYI